MSLQVWLPLTKDLRQQGLSNTIVGNTGATYSSTGGKLGGCYIFDGVDDSLTIGNLSTLVDSEYSFACWFYHDETWSSKNYETIFGGPSGFELEAKNSSTNSPVLRLYSWGGSTCAYELNKWNHVVFTRNTAETKLYLNGELKLTGTAGTIPSGNYFIGSWSSTTSQNYKGKMCDIRIYDHCLSPMEVKELAKGLVLHYPLNRQGWGQENLLSRYVVPGQAGPTSTAAGGQTTWLGDYKITIPATNNSDTYFRLFMSEQLVSGQTYTISCQVDGLLSGTAYRFPMFAQNNSAMGVLDLNHNGLNSLTFTMNWTGTQTAATGANGETVYINFLDDSSRVIASGQGPITITNFKLEKGSIVTPWCPNILDSLYTTMGLNSTTEYDCSGFCNNGTKNNITYTSDTPKYAVGSIFNGSNSYIKVDDNNWMIKGMSEMTVNIWAKATTWPTNGGRLLSCTETGGFNLEAGNSGYWRFPIYVYTNSGQTSSAYKYDSNEIKIADLIPNDWNMITLVYDNTGTKTYLNGELHHTYTNTSYGINFNTNARLFLGCEASTASPSSPYFNGIESDFRIYATALSADDVKSLYQNSAYIDSSGNVYGAVHSEV